MPRHAKGTEHNGTLASDLVPLVGLPQIPSAPIPMVPTGGTAFPDRVLATALAPRQVVFIEADVPDAQDLIRGVRPGVEVVVLDPSQDGVQQIAAWLTAHNTRNLAGVDIVAHGADGEIALGSGTLSSATLGAYQTELQQIGTALAPGGAIQLYGCNVGEDATGVAFLDQLSQATGGANIAAASHLVGDAAGGGSFDLNVNVGTVDVATPFTSNALTSFQGELTLSTVVPQLYVVWSADANGPTSITRLEQVGVSGTTFVAGSSIDLADASTIDINQLRGATFDAPLDRYFLSQAADQAANLNSAMLFEGTIGSPAAPGTINISASSSIFYTGLAFDPLANKVYLAEQVYSGLTSGSTTSMTSTIDGIGIYSFTPSANIAAAVTPTLVIDGHSTITGGGTLQGPGDIAVVPNTNLLIFTDDQEIFLGNGSAHIDVGNLLSHQWTTLAVPGTVISTAVGGAAALSVAVDATSATGGILFFTVEDGTLANNGIFSSGYTITGSGTTQSASLNSAITPLYTGAAADFPTDIVLNPIVTNGTATGNGTFYISSTNGTIYAGSMTGGGTLTAVGDLSGGSSAAESLAYESLPTIVPSAGISYAQGNTVTLSSGLSLANTDNQNLVNATVTVAAGDTLHYTTVNGIVGNFNAGTLTLSSAGTTAAAFQAALDSITFSSTAAAGTQTVNWSASDGVVIGTATSNVTIASAISLATGGTVAYLAGGAATVLDSSATVGDTNNLIGASIWINSGSIIGDTLNFSTQNGITGGYNSSTGTLTLTGTASAANYQAALDSITYSFAPSNGDPTEAGNDTARTIDWQIKDASSSSGVTTSTLDTTTPSTVVYGQTIDETGIIAATETVAAGVMTLKNSGGTTVGTIAVGTSLNTSDFTLKSDGGSGTDVIVSTVFGTYTSGVTLLTNPTTIANTAKITGSLTSGVAVQGPSGTAWTLVNDGTVSETGTASLGVTMAAGGTITNAASAVISAGAAGVLFVSGAGSVSNAGSIAGTGTSGFGVRFGSTTSGGSVTNQSGGAITGATDAIYFNTGAATGTVSNYGQITGGTSGFAGINLSGGGRVSNASGGTITGHSAGVFIANGTGATVSNAGSIAGQSYGVWLLGVGTVTNASGGIITGGYSTTSAAGVYLGDGGAVTNQSGGTIGGLRGVYVVGGAATVVNTGHIVGNNTTIGAGAAATGAGVYLGAGGSVTNQSAGTISGYFGVEVSNIAATVVNAGSIGGNSTSGNGVLLGAGGSVTNLSGGTITGYYGIKATSVAATVVNAGVVAGNYTSNYNNADGIYLGAGGTVTNQASGNIYGRNDGVKIAGARGTVINLGSIHSRIDATYGGPGVSLGAGGLIVNGASGGTASTAFIGGYNYAVQFGTTGVGTLMNYGTISGAPGTVAVSMNSGTVINGASGATGALIVSGLQSNAVVISGVGTVANYGSITGLAANGEPHVSYGVSIGGNGSVASSIRNLGSNALITGYVAVYAAQNATVTNAGTMEATQTFGGTAPLEAVVFGGGTNRLIIDPGAVFIGGVNGSGAVTVAPGGQTTVLGTANGVGTTTLELASGASAGTMSGLGTKYVGFTAVAIDTGARWTFAGNNTLASGVTLTNSGTDTVIGTLVNAGKVTATGTLTGVSVGSGGLVSNQSGGTIAAYYAAVVSSATGRLVNSGRISAASTGAGTGVKLASGGSFTNSLGGTVTGDIGVYATGASAATIVNAGSINGQGGGNNGVALLGGGTFSNLNGGTVTNGAFFLGVAGTLINAGFITGTHAAVSLTAGGTVINQTGGTLSGSLAAVQFTAGRTARVIDNPGAVFVGKVEGGNTIGAASISTLELASGAATGTLSGLGAQFTHFAQVTIDAGASWAVGGTVTGFATLTDAGNVKYGITLGAASLTVSNQSTGTIDGGSGIGVYARTNATAARVVNAGLITATTAAGVQLAGGGSVTNVSGGTISGYSGIAASGTLATLVNAGVINGSRTNTGAYGVKLSGGGSVTNQSTGTITAYNGVAIVGAAGTVLNQGTIASSQGAAGEAVRFTSGGGRLIESPTATLIGGAYGGVDSAAVLELASGASAGTIAGFGTSVVNFSSIVFDTGSRWTIRGNDSANGLGTLSIAGFTIGDTIDLTGFAAISRTYTSNTLVLTDGASNHETLQVQGTFSTSNFALIADGSGGTDIVIANPPTIASGGTVTFTGGGSAVTLDSTLAITDPESTTVVSGTVSFGSGFRTGDTLNFINQNSITGSFDAATGTLSLSGSASVADYQAALDSVTYSFAPSNGDPTGGGSDTSRTIDWTVNDGTVASTVSTSTLDVLHVAPTVTASGTVTFVAGGSAVALDSALSLSDVDSGGLLNGATISIVGFASGDVLSADTTGLPAITASYNAATGVLTLSGSDTLADYQAVLDSVAFSSTVSDPTAGGTHPTRTISWSVNDGAATSGAATTTVDVTLPPPVIANTVAGQTTTDEASLSPFSAVSISDSDFGQTETVTVTLSNKADGTLSNVGTGSYNSSTGVYTVTGTDLAVSTAVDGLLFTPTAHQVAPGATVTTSFTIKATDTNGSTSSNSTTTVIATAVNDPPVITGTVAGQSTTDAATILPFSGVSISDVDPGQTETVTITLSDKANGALSNLAGGSYNSSTGVYTVTGSDAAVTTAVDGLVFTPTAHETAPGSTITTTFTIQATDTAGGTGSNSTTTVVATAVNDAPVISGTASGQTTSDAAAIAPFASVSISDADFGQTETVTVTLSNKANGALSNLGVGLYDSSTGVYSVTGTDSAVTAALQGLVFTPTDHQVAPGATVTTGFTIAVTDTSGATNSSSAASVVATAVEDPPAITGPVSGQLVNDNATDDPSSTVTIIDPDAGASETVTITLTVNSVASDANGVLSGTGLSKTGVGSYTLTTGTPTAVTALLDALVFTPTQHEVTPGATVTTGMTLSVTDGIAGSPTTNNATSVITTAIATPPLITGALANQSVPNETSSTPFSTVTLVDPNVGATDTVTVTVTMSAAGNGTFSNLGSGSYDPATGIYSVTGTAAAVTAALDALVFTPIAQANIDVTTTQFTIDPGAGGATDSSTNVTSVQQILGLASVPTGQIAISVSPGGSSFAPAQSGKTNEAVVTAPAENASYSVPTGYQALFAGGKADVTLSDTAVGNAILVANQGNDELIAGAPNDILVAGSGNDSLVGGAYANTVMGGVGFTTVFAGAGAMHIIEGSGPMFFSGSSNAGSTISGGSGALVADLTGSHQTAEVGSGPATITAAGSGNAVIGGTSSLTATITGAADTVQAGSGSTTVVSGGSGDLIMGSTVAGAGPLMVTEAGSNDTIQGGTNPTTVTASSATQVYGGSGSLNFVGGAGMSTVFGGSGATSVTAGAGGVIFNVDGASNATVNSGAGAVTVFGAPNTSVDLIGSSGLPDYVVAGAGNETLNASGSSSSNWLSVATTVSSESSVVMVGGSGSDTLVAGSAPDSEIMTGGGGADAFVFFKQVAGGASDIITDFNANDAIYIEGYGPGSASALQAASTVTAAGLTLTLSDGTTITFSDLTDRSALNGKIQYG